MSLPAVTAAVEVGVDPATAFTIFTERIDEWWVRSPYAWNDAARAVGMRLEPGVGGRWVEVHDAATGEGFEIGRVAIWEPGARLVMSYRDADLPEPVTEVEVRFQAVEGGTRVTIEHRGWERVDPELAARKTARKGEGWQHVLTWFAQGTVRDLPHPQARVVPYLMVGDLDAAVAFLTRAFGLVERYRLPGHAELDLDGAPVMLGQPPEDGDTRPPSRLGGVSQYLYVYVADLDARWEKAVAAGARVVEELSDRSYGQRNFTVEDVDGHRWCFAQAAA